MAPIQFERYTTVSCPEGTLNFDEDAPKLLIAARSFMANAGFRMQCDDVRIVMVTSRRMYQMYGDEREACFHARWRSPFNPATCLNGAYIELVTGMSNAKAFAMIVHELTHLWVVYADLGESFSKVHAIEGEEALCDIMSTIAALSMDQGQLAYGRMLMVQHHLSYFKREQRENAALTSIRLFKSYRRDHGYKGRCVVKLMTALVDHLIKHGV